jgi:hypothetical protein
MTAVVLSFAAAREQRLEDLAWRALQCLTDWRQSRPGTWWREICEAELNTALRRLSEAQGMPRAGSQHS